MPETDQIKPPSPWRPETDLLRLAVLGKLIEELGECVSAATRCVIQGIDESEPISGKPNRQWLEDEIADVEAMTELAKNHFGLDRYEISRRRDRKIGHKTEWHQLIRLMQVEEKAGG